MPLHEFDRIVEQLNTEFDLNITARRNFPLPSNEDGIARDIYFKLRKDYTDDRARFDRNLRTFKSNAYKNWVFKPLADEDTLPSTPAGRAPLGGRFLSTTERAELYKKLGEVVLGDHPQPERPTRSSRSRPNKRESDEHDGGRSKRSRSTRERSLSPEKSLVRRFKSQYPDLSMSSRCYNKASASTSRDSFTSTTFSIPQEPEQTPFSSQDTTVNDRKPIDSQEFDISSTDEQAIAESFSMLQEPDRDHVKPSCFNLSTRFQGIWPALPENGLNHLELPVLWEITRTALHCDVDLRALDEIESLDLGAGCEADCDPIHFIAQEKLYTNLRKLPVFSRRSLPSFSSVEAWNVSLGKGGERKPHHVAVYKAELLYNPQDSNPENAMGQLTKAFRVKLHPLEIRLGHRLDRRFGFDRFLELVVPALEHNNPELAEVIPWLIGEHAFLGRRWRPFFIKRAKKTIREKGKDGEVKEKQSQLYILHMFAVDGNSFYSTEDPDKAPPSLNGASAGKEAMKCTVRGLLNWTLNLPHPKNTGQPALKLFSRLALSLSRSNPGKVLEKQQIINEPKDVLSSDDDKTEMNDGLGIMSRALARQLAEELSLTDIPSAFQGRLGSAKGMWLIDVNEDISDSSIWIKTYPSQRKWECDFEDQQHRTFEIKSFPLSSRVKSTSLNLQFIPVLEHGAVDQAKIRYSLEQRLRFCLEQETAAETEALNDPRRLLKLVFKAGPERNLAFKGGLPSSDEDRALLMLLSGFTPQNEFLAQLLWKLRQEKTDELKKRMKIQIPCSAYLYMVADMWGILEAGEVHISFSDRFSAEGSEDLGVPGYSDTMVDEVDVLVARSPAHLPSDIQRVRAVSHPKLRKLKNVIVFSIKGKRPLADYLSGGDYDGDMAWVCWDREIVTNFKNSSEEEEPPEYDFVEQGYLHKDTVTFQDLLWRHGAAAAYDEFLHKGLSFAMQEDMLGICTKHKERISYKLGVGHLKTVLESVLLGKLVDQAKAGITFTFASWKRFRKTLEYPIVDSPLYEQDKAPDKWLRDVMRGRKIPHILDFLKFMVADGIINATLMNFKQALYPKGNLPRQFDQDLTGFYYEACRWGGTSRTGSAIINALKTDIGELQQFWGKMDGDFDDMVQLVYAKFMAIEPRDKLKSSRTINCLNEVWMRYSAGARVELENPGTTEWSGQLSRWTLLKASALFAICYQKRCTMCWHVAGRQLLHLKASVVGARSKDTIPMLVVPDMFNVLRPDNVAIKRLAAKQAADESVLALEEVNDSDEEWTVIDDA